MKLLRLKKQLVIKDNFDLYKFFALEKNEIRTKLKNKL